MLPSHHPRFIEEWEIPKNCVYLRKSWLIGKDSDAGRDWGQEEKGTTEDEMAGWHHRLDGREFEWTPGDGDGQGGLACCDSWGCKELDTTEWLNWTELNWDHIYSLSHPVSPFLFTARILKKIVNLQCFYLLNPHSFFWKVHGRCIYWLKYYIG